MRNLKIFCLLACIWLMVGGCNRRGGTCGEGPAVINGMVHFDIKDELGRNYIAAKQLPPGSLVVYDANLNYATALGGMLNWEQEQKYYFGDYREVRIDFAKKSEPIGVVQSKTFYVKIDKDMDTLKVEYKILDGCMRMGNFRAYYNDQIVHKDDYVSPSADYFFNVIKK